MKHKQIVSIDFDGVIHSYKSGWKGARNIPDPPNVGSIQWIEEFITFHCSIPDSICAMASEGKFEIAIFSSRSRYIGGRKAIKKWLVKYGLDKRYLEVIKFPLFKPPSFIHIDDRCYLFTGTFPQFNEILNFKPWWKNS